MADRHTFPPRGSSDLILMKNPPRVAIEVPKTEMKITNKKAVKKDSLKTETKKQYDKAQAEHYKAKKRRMEFIKSNTQPRRNPPRSEEHTSELQSREKL